MFISLEQLTYGQIMFDSYELITTFYCFIFCFIDFYGDFFKSFDGFF